MHVVRCSLSWAADASRVPSQLWPHLSLAAPASCSSDAVRVSSCQAADISHEHRGLAPAPEPFSLELLHLRLGLGVAARPLQSTAQHIDTCICP